MVEGNNLPELTKRQEEILSLIIHTYTSSPEPVSSNQLVRDHNLSVSSATVRNEMARLEELGYITAPHTSAGRIPTTLGYRYFVKTLQQGKHELSLNERDHINRRFRELPVVLEQWLKQAATLLARTSSSASLITPPISQDSRFKHLELISIQGRLALMVLVMQGGTVHQRMLTLAEPVNQLGLSESADRINALCGDLTAVQMRLKGHQLNTLEREVLEIAADLIDSSGQNRFRVIYRDGLSEVINTFSDSEGAQQAVRVFEERAFLDMILTEILQPLVSTDVHVVIAGDGRYEELDRLSLVLGHYGLPGQISGTLGVIGPTNINYGRAISSVRYISGVMTDMLDTLYDTGLPEPDTIEADDKDDD